MSTSAYQSDRGRVCRGTLVGAVLVAFSACAGDASPDATAVPTIGPADLEVGALDAPAEEVFGDIRDVEALPGGGVAVLDAQAFEVRLFDSAGDFTGSYGRAGEGPGEFQSPEALLAPNDSTLFVLEGGLRIIELSLDSGSLAFRRDFGVDAWGRDFCAVNERTFVQGGHDGRGVHEVDATGALLRSFHEPPPYPFDLGDFWNVDLEDAALSGHIACSSASERVFVASEWLPTIRSYTPSGELVWETVIPDFELRVPTLVNDGRGMRWETVERADYLVSLESLPELLVVQTLTIAEGESFRDAKPRTYLLEPTSGALISGPLDDLPTFKGAQSGSLWGSETIPYPRVARHPIRAGSE